MNRIIRKILSFLADIYEKRYILKELIKRDTKQVYTGSVLGFTWTIIQPVAMTIIFMVVFGMGFKSAPVDNVPFVVWFLCGLIPWNYFTVCITSNTSVIHQYSFLVKKINFRVSVLPIVKIMSSLLVNVAFVMVLCIILLIYGMEFSLYWFQFIYYLVALMFLLLGLSWFLSAIDVFARDVEQLVGIILQLGFFATPIFWNIEVMKEPFRTILMYNPMYYIIEGYRNSFIFHIPFWNNIEMGLYYWGVTLFFMILGILVFSRLRPQFADVL